MYNDFVIIGSAGDTAGLKGQSVKDALNAIETNQAVFVSRGDNSGTHKKELSLWEAAGLSAPEKQNWYVQTGQGRILSS
jgi:tungstate transport system substrate-binding protein